MRSRLIPLALLFAQFVVAGEPTPSNIEGPYYKENSPERASLLEPGMPGTKLIIKGTVFSTDGKPIARARLDFWQADARGRYDHRGYRLRGHQFTDEAGRYTLETIVPGQYGGRTPHIHVKVEAPNFRPLTTQLFLPDEPRNQRDSLFDPALVLKVQDTKDGKQAGFDFVLQPK
jgi:protocatechuate 3,4-dioxygenase beta subunit